ncbi:uncharacterized protein N7511_008627 [Penicillium nucicola]|uniref:uncharacterized protein n=1 Tax=Penicillium nucicola TaxID=1850975 RepID=UPI0025458416|nr:uncharacterized protein N7511_008627 [Penicillium nucicola]KAJ5746931.1 hypothetical protein N7511_008627 [Penicillium nucicola]
MTSALLKLANHHSCDMQIENSQMMAPEIAPRVRQCMQQSIEITKELCNQIVSFVRNIQGLAACNLENVSPLILQCIYTCASNMSWMAVETGNSHYTESKNVCEDMLYTLSNRWEVAGVYMEMQRMSDITLHESV